jgi:hypothetical protein
MGRLFLQHLEGQAYSCRTCKCHLASLTELVSKVLPAAPGAGCTSWLAGRKRMGSPTLQTLQEPILLLPWVCFRATRVSSFQLTHGCSAWVYERWLAGVAVATRALTAGRECVCRASTVDTGKRTCSVKW